MLPTITNIEKARAVRDRILEMDDVVERISLVAHGAEYPCWRIVGEGWHALLCNLWDFHVAVCRGRGETPNLQSNVITYDFLEVYSHGEPVLSFCYGNDVDGEHLFEFVNGDWLRHFELAKPIATASLLRAA